MVRATGITNGSIFSISASTPFSVTTISSRVRSRTGRPLWSDTAMMNENGSSCASGTACARNAATAAARQARSHDKKPAWRGRGMALYGTAKRPRTHESARACEGPILEIELQGHPDKPRRHERRRVQPLIALVGGRRRVVRGRRPYAVHEAAGQRAVVAVDRV